MGKLIIVLWIISPASFSIFIDLLKRETKHSSSAHIWSKDIFLLLTRFSQTKCMPVHSNSMTGKSYRLSTVWMSKAMAFSGVIDLSYGLVRHRRAWAAALFSINKVENKKSSQLYLFLVRSFPSLNLLNFPRPPLQCPHSHHLPASCHIRFSSILYFLFIHFIILGHFPLHHPDTCPYFLWVSHCKLYVSCSCFLFPPKLLHAQKSINLLLPPIMVTSISVAIPSYEQVELDQPSLSAAENHKQHLVTLLQDGTIVGTCPDNWMVQIHIFFIYFTSLDILI